MLVWVLVLKLSIPVFFAAGADLCRCPGLVRRFVEHKYGCTSSALQLLKLQLKALNRAQLNLSHTCRHPVVYVLGGYIVPCRLCHPVYAGGVVQRYR